MKSQRVFNVNAQKWEAPKWFLRLTAGNLVGDLFLFFACPKWRECCAKTIGCVLQNVGLDFECNSSQSTHAVRSFFVHCGHSLHFGFQRTIDSEWILDILGEAQPDAFADVSLHLLCVVDRMCWCPGGAKAPKSDDDELVQRFATP